MFVCLSSGEFVRPTLYFIMFLMCALIDLQLDMCDASEHRFFCDDLRQFATTLYIYSPKAYEFVRKHYRLPHPRTLRR